MNSWISFIVHRKSLLNKLSYKKIRQNPSDKTVKSGEFGVGSADVDTMGQNGL